IVIATRYAVGASRGWTTEFIVWFDFGVALCCCWIVDRAGQLSGFAARLGSMTPLVWLGGGSYGVYILHNFVPFLIERAARAHQVPWPRDYPLSFLVGSSCTVLVAALLFHGFEKRINGLKRYFPYRRGSPPRA